MEQYIHTLISTDSEFRPDSAQIAGFYQRLVSQFGFCPISDQRWLPGLIVRKPSGKLRWGTNAMTGEKISIPEQGRRKLEEFEDIPAAIEGCTHCTVSQSGQWAGMNRPIDLVGADGVPFEGTYLCTVSCELRSRAVSTSAWDVEAGPNTRDVPEFGSPCKGVVPKGIFPNPWTGVPIEVEGAGCARFWVEFEFGKFIYPKAADTLNVMRHAIVRGVEECFETSFAQGCRFW
jgi:hypothetical protein